MPRNHRSIACNEDSASRNQGSGLLSKFVQMRTRGREARRAHGAILHGRMAAVVVRHARHTGAA